MRTLISRVPWGVLSGWLLRIFSILVVGFFLFAIALVRTILAVFSRIPRLFYAALVWVLNHPKAPLTGKERLLGVAFWGFIALLGFSYFIGIQLGFTFTGGSSTNGEGLRPSPSPISQNLAVGTGSHPSLGEPQIIPPEQSYRNIEEKNNPLLEVSLTPQEIGFAQYLSSLSYRCWNGAVLPILVSPELFRLFQQVEETSSYPWNFALAITWTENPTFDPRAEGPPVYLDSSEYPLRALGLSQLMPETFQRFKPYPGADIFNPADNLSAAVNFQIWLGLGEVSREVFLPRFTGYNQDGTRRQVFWEGEWVDSALWNEGPPDTPAWKQAETAYDMALWLDQVYQLYRDGSDVEGNVLAKASQNPYFGASVILAGFHDVRGYGWGGWDLQAVGNFRDLKAFHEGTVRSGREGPGGNFVVIEWDDNRGHHELAYFHLAFDPHLSGAIQEGDWVGVEGATGSGVEVSHVHITHRIDGVASENPFDYLD